MPLVTFRELLADAKARSYAVGSFNAWDLLSAKSVVAAAERMRSPLIISLWQPELEFAGERELWGVCTSLGMSAAVPVAVFIDHAKTVDEAARAIRHGATSVMIDGSHLPFEQNILFTSKAATVAHGAGVSIEGEIGVLGEEDGADPDEALFTDPNEAALFARRTGVDALAVAIGNAHGFYRKEPRLDFDRLSAIAGATEVPLVLHGGSGIPTDDLHRAIDLGITKVNIGAEPRSAFMEGLRRALSECDAREKFPHRVFPQALRRHAECVMERMSWLRSEGKA